MKYNRPQATASWGSMAGTVLTISCSPSHAGSRLRRRQLRGLASRRLRADRQTRPAYFHIREEFTLGPSNRLVAPERVALALEAEPRPESCPAEGVAQHAEAVPGDVHRSARWQCPLCAKSGHSGGFWILLSVGKGTQVRGSSPVKLTRRRFLHLTVGAAAIPAFSRTASAETYPTRPAIGHNCGPPMDELPATPGQDLRGMPRDLSCYYGCLPARQF